MTQQLFEIPGQQASIRGVTSSAAGQAAELLLAARLLQRGHRVAVPIVDDDGVDLVVDYRLSVQVKLAERNGHGWRVKLRHHGQQIIRPHVNVLAAYVPEIDTWWHIPIKGMTNTSAIGLIESSWREAWDVYETRGDAP